MMILTSIVLYKEDTISKALGATNTPRAFPGAQGFGSTTPGGRGGQVIKVTNLNDSGPGSLREAVESSGKRIVIFDVAGVILLNTDIEIESPYITIAGQTSPGNGIALRRGTLDIKTHDVVVRGMKIRVGDDSGGPSPTSRDGVSIGPSWSNPGASAVYNVIMDHNSISWGVDETVSTWTDGNKNYNVVHDVTFSWNIISESLYDSIHVDEGSSSTSPHSMGVLLGENNTKITMHHNLLAHNDDRNPRFAGITSGEFISNVVYDWGSGPTKFSGDKSLVHIINNYYKAGASSRKAEIQFGSSSGYNSSTGVNSSMHSQTKTYITGNLANDPRDGNTVPMSIRMHYDEARLLSASTLFSGSGVTTDSAASTYNLVLGNAGANLHGRDAIDTRVISQVQNRTGSIIDSQNEVGGWSIYSSSTRPSGFDTDNDGIPDSWEEKYGLNPSSNDANGDLDGDGYTNIEEYINDLIPMVYGGQNPPMIEVVGGETPVDDSDPVGQENYETPTDSSLGPIPTKAKVEELSKDAQQSNTELLEEIKSCERITISGQLEGEFEEEDNLYGVLITLERVDSDAVFVAVTEEDGSWNLTLCAGQYIVGVDTDYLPVGYENEEIDVSLDVDYSKVLGIALTGEGKEQEEMEEWIQFVIKYFPHALFGFGSLLSIVSIFGLVKVRRDRKKREAKQ